MTVLVTAVLSLWLAQSPVQPIQGIVVRVGTSEPLSKALVELRTDPDGAVLDRATTEEDGRFAFSPVRAGRYRVAGTRRGYVQSSRTINVVVGQPISDIRLALNSTGTISGRVYDTNSQPLGNLEVQALRVTYAGGRHTLTSVQTALTNDLGEYRIFWLPAGRYYVAATNPEANPFSRMFNPLDGITMSYGGPNGKLLITNSTLDPAVGTLERRMNPIQDSSVPIFFGGTVDEQAATEIDLRASAEFTGANIVMFPVRTRHVRGTVVDALTGRPAQYANVTAEQNQKAVFRAQGEANRETGAFDIVLLPGTHALNVGSANGSGYAVVKVTDADIENFNIPVMADFDISGRVVLEGQQGDNTALESLRISLRRDSPVEDPPTSAYSNPLRNGALTVSASVGDFRVNIAPILNVDGLRVPVTLPPSLQNAYVKSIRLGNVDVLNTGVHLERPPENRLEIVIATNPGTLNGQVTTLNATTVADLTVVLLPDLRRRTDLYRTAPTDATGQFHFDSIPPGDYKVFAWEDVDDGAWYDPEFIRTRENDGIRVRIVEGQTENVQVPLKR